MTRRILVLAASPTLTGPVHPVCELAKLLKRSGCEVIVASDTIHEGDLQSWLRSWDLNHTEDFFLCTHARPDQHLRDLLRLRKWCQHREIDLVLTTESHALTLAVAARSLGRNRVPIVHYLNRTPKELEGHPARLALLRQADGLLLPYTSDRSHWARVLHIPEKRLWPLPNLVDRERFHVVTEEAKQQSRQIFGLPPQARVIGSIGRFKAGRGQVELVRHFADIAGSYPNLHLLLIGWGEDLPLARYLAAERKLAHRIHFPGFLNERLPAAYQAMDALFLPAVGRDASGRAALEAMASGVAVFGVAHPGLRERIEAACCGEVFEESDDVASRRMLQQIATRSDLEQLGIQARRFIDQLQLESVAAQTLLFVDGLMRTDT